ncbi:MAG TPA: hypothetical protein PLO89_02155 [Spirochaetota bacterium]|nr:hypothetical protein [Spirochaetota bacterium]
MNQDLVKEKLLLLETEMSFEGENDFKVTFSGKKSQIVNGLYKPDLKEIIIHNKNFSDDNSLIYTAIHEFAHHISYINSGGLRTSKSHSSAFWSLFHRLLIRAEDLGVYKNIFESNLEFVKLTGEIKEKYLTKNGELMKEFGKVLASAMELCLKYNVRFEDYVDRGLLLPRNTAKSLVNIYAMDVNPKIGYENMKIVASIKDDDKRLESQNAFLEGQSPDMVKNSLSSENKNDNVKDRLEKERLRIEKTIENLRKKLEEIDSKLEEF